MKRPSSVPDLAELRPWCGVPQKLDSPISEFQQIRPGYERKVYCTGAPKERWIYQGAVLQPYKARRPFQEIAALVDPRSLDEIQEQANAALEQILARAHCGDEQAIRTFAEMVANAVASLERLSDFEPDNLKAVASTSARWPVLLSLNPHDIKWAKDHLRSLRAGAETPNPPNPRQRLDPRHFWTRRAAEALGPCRLNRVLVPWLRAHAKGARKERKSVTYWRTPVAATFYYLNSREVILITDWQKRCAKLSEPITTNNFTAWWEAAKGCVLQHWHNKEGKADYAEAIKRIRYADTTAHGARTHLRKEDCAEGRRRAHALEQIRRALASLVGLEVPHVRPPAT
jgi:hypothetical protein